MKFKLYYLLAMSCIGVVHSTSRICYRGLITFPMLIMVIIDNVDFRRVWHSGEIDLCTEEEKRLADLKFDSCTRYNKPQNESTH